MNKQMRLTLLLLCFMISTTGIMYSQQVSQDLIEKAKAMGATEEMIEQELAKFRQQNGVTSVQSQFSDDNPDGLETDRSILTDETILPQELQQLFNTPEEDISLMVFGREIFSNKNLSFEPGFNIPTPKNYRLAAGDELLIQVWGDSELNLKRVISPEGMINIPNLGPVYVNGLTIEGAESRIRQELGRIMSNLISGESNTFVSVSLGQIRSLKVHIVGEAIAPGSYTLPSFATLFNALYAAGGVNDIGTLRNIKVFRNNKEVASLDVYDYLLNGQYNANIRLEDNDMIIIGPYEQLVAVKGKVKRNRLFEVRPNETLQQVLDMAGGFTGDAYTSDVRVKRKTGERHRIATVTSDEFSRFLMHDGDSLIIDSVIPFYENRLTISGAVWRPGEYELREGVSTVKELVNQAKGLKGDEFTGRASITRLNPDFTTSVIAVDIRGIMNGTSPDIVLMPEDILNVPSLFDLREEYTITVAGAVNYADTILPYSYNMTIEDAIIMAGGLSEAASMINVEVARRIKNPLSTTSTNRIAEEFNFTLSPNMEIVSGESMFILEPFDEIYVRFSPGYSTQQVVKINGEVTFAGNYVLSEKNSRLSDVISKAGGITPEAYVKGASLRRQLTEDELRRLETLLELSVRNAGGRDSMAVADIDLKDYFVGIDLTKALRRPGSEDDLVLRDGDELYIPQLQSTVKINGTVVYPNSVTYTKNMSVRDCIAQAGGYSDISRKYPIVIYMNGKVATTKKVGIFFKKYPKVEPGCEILVPAKAQRGRAMSMAEIFSLSSSTTSMAAMITSLINTINNNKK